MSHGIDDSTLQTIDAKSKEIVEILIDFCGKLPEKIQGAVFTLSFTKVLLDGISATVAMQPKESRRECAAGLFLKIRKSLTFAETCVGQALDDDEADDGVTKWKEVDVLCP